MVLKIHDKNKKSFKFMHKLTCVSDFVNIQDNINNPTGIRFKVNDNHGGTDGNPTIMAPTIIKKIVPGVSNDDINRNSW